MEFLAVICLVLGVVALMCSGKAYLDYNNNDNTALKCGLLTIIFIGLGVVLFIWQASILNSEFKLNVDKQNYIVKKAIVSSISTTLIHTEAEEYYYLDIKNGKLKSLETIGVGTAVKIKYLVNDLTRTKYIMDIENLEGKGIKED